MSEETKQEEVQVLSMCIDPTGEIFDTYLETLPVVGHRLQIGKRNFMVTESHESMVPEFKFVVTLGR